MIHRQEIQFRPLEPDDFTQLFHWLQNPSVARWYGPPPESLAQIESKYIQRTSPASPISCFLITVDERPVGYIQKYSISSEPEYAEALDVDRGATGIDLYIGEDDYRHRGFGPVILREFARAVVFAEPDTSYAIIAPAASNQAAIRAYEKAGFRHLKTVPVPSETEPEYVMALWRGELLDSP